VHGAQHNMRSRWDLGHPSPSRGPSPTKSLLCITSEFAVCRGLCALITVGGWPLCGQVHRLEAGWLSPEANVLYNSFGAVTLKANSVVQRGSLDKALVRVGTIASNGDMFYVSLRTQAGSYPSSYDTSLPASVANKVFVHRFPVVFCNVDGYTMSNTRLCVLFSRCKLAGPVATLLGCSPVPHRCHGWQWTARSLPQVPQATLSHQS
jgi:hypothetical protein